jgi:selenide,water dikinase
VEFEPAIPPEMRRLLFTPETSGGLLVAAPPDSLQKLTTLFADADEMFRVIGEAEEGQGIHVVTE